MVATQVVLDDDFEAGAIDDADRWLFIPTQEADIADGIAIVKSGSTETNAWHAAKIPDSTEQQMEAAVVSYAEGADKHVGIYLRLDDSLTVAAFAPDRAYLCRLSYEASAVRKLEIIRVNSGHVEVVLGIVADVGVVGTGDMIERSGANLGVLQDLRFTVSNEGQGVRLRAFVNEDDDENPTLSVLDLGLNTTTSVPVRDAGLFGFEIKSATGEVGIDRIQAKDRFIVPTEDIHSTRTLAQLRTNLRDEITRGGNTSLSAALLDRELNLAQEEVMRSIRGMSIFTLREKLVTLTVDSADNRVVEMPSNMESIEEITSSPARTFIGFALVGMNDSNTALRLRLTKVLDGTVVRVRYHTKWNEMTSDDDRCIVPRLYDETIILGAAKRIARRATDAAWYGTMVQEYSHALRTMKKYLNSLGNMERKRFRPVPAGNVYSRDARYVDDPNKLW